MNFELDHIFKQYNFNLAYAKILVDDLSDEQMTTTPSSGLENHPAFTIGHLVSGSAMLVEDLGHKFPLREGWTDLFLRKGPGDPMKPETDSTKYPSKYILLEELELTHNKVKSILLSSSSEKLNEHIKWRFDNYFPTLFDLAIFMCTTHEAMHLGQLASWRRAMNLPSALAKL